MASKRETDTSSAPTAKFLQARVTALSTSCIKRLENIFAAALDEDHSRYQAPPTSTDASAPPPPALTETAVKQLQLDVESSALVRSAEDFMVLTRALKELWLFGGLDTIPEGENKDADIKRQMEKDEELVVEAFLKLLAKTDGVTRTGSNGVSEKNGTND